MKSISPREYASLPKLDAPAGYIIVLRLIDRDAYRFDRTDHPAIYLRTLLAEMTGSFGIELVAVLESEDLAASKSRLFDAYHARLSDDWIYLDSHQLAELRQSELQINVHSSHYLTRQESTPSQQATVDDNTRNKTVASSYSRSPQRQSGRAPATFKQYGRDGLRRHRYQPVPAPVNEDAPEPPERPEPGTWGYKFWVWSQKHPNLQERIVTVVAVIIIVLLIWYSIQNPATIASIFK